MGGKKQAGETVVKTTDNPVANPSTQQQSTPQVTEKVKVTCEVQLTEKNPFELKIHNKGRRRLLQFCGVFLEAGQTTIVTLKDQLEVDHVKDTLRQFNELAGRDDLVVEEAE